MFDHPDQYQNQQLTLLDFGFGRYENYVVHSDKHEVLENHLRRRLPLEFQGYDRIRILDIGVGTGRLTREILLIFSKAGIKSEVKALEPCGVARAKFRDTLGELMNQVDLVDEGFSAHAPLGKQRFDLIVACHVSYYFDDKNALVQKVMNSLSPGGKALFVATSITVLQNSIYQTILPKLRSKSELVRTFESDGLFDFAENIEIALFDQNVSYSRSVLPSQLTFSTKEMAMDLQAIRSGSDDVGPILKAISFLWRVPEVYLLEEGSLWCDLFHGMIERNEALCLSYEDVVMVITKRK